MHSIGSRITVSGLFFAALMALAGGVLAQDSGNNSGIDYELEGDTLEPRKPVVLSMQVGGLWLFPEPEDDIYEDFFFEPAITYGVHFLYNFWDGLSAQLGVLTANPRFRLHKENKALGYHTEPRFHDVRLALQYHYNFVDGYIRPFVSVGPSLAILDFNQKIDDFVAPGLNASVGCMFFFDTWIGFEAKGGYNYYFPQDEFDSLYSWNLYGGFVFAF